jgi:hypothetical protein
LRSLRRALAAAGWIPSAFAAASALRRQKRVTGLCDRACLKGVLDQYLNAVIATQPVNRAR